MTKLTDKQLRDALRATSPGPPLPDPKRFWASFQARASLLPRNVRAIEERPLWARFAIVSTAAAAVLLLSFNLPRLIGPPTSHPLSKVDSVDVFVDYTTVMIVEDTENKGTVIWVGGVSSTNDS